MPYPFHYIPQVYHRTKCDIISQIYHPLCRTDIIEKKVLRLFFSWAARRGTRLSGRSVFRNITAVRRTTGYRLPGGMPFARLHLLSRVRSRLNKFDSLGHCRHTAYASDGRCAASLSEAACRSSPANAAPRGCALAVGSGYPQTPLFFANLLTTNLVG